MSLKSRFTSQYMVKISYTNWRGQTALREIYPIGFSFGATRYHPKKQWLLKAYDIDKMEYRQFAMKEIKSWQGSDD